MTSSEIRSCGPEDRDALLALHNRAFGPPRWDEAWWDWRFHRLPAGGSEVLGAFEASGECKAIYAGVRHRLLYDGEECYVLSHSDVAVAPELRTGLGGSGLLIRMAELFFDSYGGGETQLMYGIPEPALRRVVVRHMRSEVLTDLLFLAHDLADTPPAPAAVEVRTVAGFDEETDALWGRVRGELGAAIVRDSAYLNLRYRDHPRVDYRLLEARDAASGALRGLAILRDGGWDPGVGTLSEWLVPGGDEEAELALTAAAVDDARARRHRALVAWFPAPAPQFQRFQRAYGFFAHPTPYQLVVRNWRNGIDRRWLHERWYQTMGDVDFF
ncbi:MAG: GNAT family N-acetyltransferase [Planctomycetota bacterium]